MQTENEAKKLLRAVGRAPGRERPMRHYLRVSGTLFGLIALGHLLRLLYRVPAELGQWVVPPWVSAIGVLLSGALAVWAFRLGRRVQRQI